MASCPWLAQKVNEPLLKLLSDIQKKQKTVFFRFFTGNSLRKNALLQFIQDLEKVLGEETFEVILGKPYGDIWR